MTLEEIYDGSFTNMRLNKLKINACKVLPQIETAISPSFYVGIFEIAGGEIDVDFSAFIAEIIKISVEPMTIIIRNISLKDEVANSIKPFENAKDNITIQIDENSKKLFLDEVSAKDKDRAEEAIFGKSTVETIA